MLAWEWLRRRPDYQEAAGRFEAPGGKSGPAPLVEAAHWGLHRYEPPHLALPDARPIWRADSYLFVLSADARAEGPAEERFDLAGSQGTSSVVDEGTGTEHLLLTDGLRSIRLDIVTGTVTNGPVRLHYRISGFAAAKRALLVLRRFLALCDAGRFSDALHAPDARAKRLILMLRAYDALCSGATQREIAAALLSPASSGKRWRVAEPSLRSRVQRLVRAARAMAGQGYTSLLRR